MMCTLITYLDLNSEMSEGLKIWGVAWNNWSAKSEGGGEAFSKWFVKNLGRGRVPPPCLSASDIPVSFLRKRNLLH